MRPWGRYGVDALLMAGGAGLAWLLIGRGDGLAIGAAFAALWWVAVVVVVRSDLDHFIIPDEASLAIAMLGLAQAGTAAARLSAAPADILIDVAAALFNGAAGFGLFWLVRRLYRTIGGREGLGFGDVKLAGASAIWLSVQDAAIALEIAALAALVMLLSRRRAGSLRDVAVPFGAFLAPAAWLAFVAGPLLHSILDGLA